MAVRQMQHLSNCLSLSGVLDMINRHDSHSPQQCPGWILWRWHIELLGASFKQHCLSCRAVTSRGATKLTHEFGWGALLQLVLLWFGRRWRRKATQRFELLSLAISLPDALACLLASPLLPESKFHSRQAQHATLMYHRSMHE